MLINDLGVVAGTLRGTVGRSDHLFVWDRDKGLTDMGNPEYISQQSKMYVSDLNNHGQVIGWIQPVFSTHVHGEIGIHPYFFYDPSSGFHKIDPVLNYPDLMLPSINDRGQVVGSKSQRLSDGVTETRIVLWDIKSGLQDINLIGATAREINNSGHILGWDQSGVFLWTPEDGCITLQDIPYTPFFYLHLNESDEVFGFTEQADHSKKCWYYRWNQNEGCQQLHPIEQNWNADMPIIAMNDQRILYYILYKRFNWFGLFGYTEFGKEIQLFTIGEGMKKLRLPQTGSKEGYWSMNRKGWLAGIVGRKAYVMIPKDAKHKKGIIKNHISKSYSL